MRPIDADAVLKKVLSIPPYCGHCDGYGFVQLDMVEDAIKDAPTIETEPVKHGRWNVANDGTHFCSECGCDASYTWDDIDRFFINSADDVPDHISNYCPNCGCKMDLEET